METITILVFTIYLPPMLVCFYIAYYIFNDKKGYYMAGGGPEIMVCIMVAFLPAVNIVIALMIGGSHFINKIRN